jgi:hypothetical protein
MSKGKELNSVNRSLGEIKLSSFRGVLIPGENPYNRIDILHSFQLDCEHGKVSVLPDVCDSKLNLVNFGIIPYSNIQQAR